MADIDVQLFLLIKENVCSSCLTPDCKYVCSTAQLATGLPTRVCPRQQLRKSKDSSDLGWKETEIIMAQAAVVSGVA
jgi:hypothetical protein